ncbi:putative myosin light chain kinase 3, partial [Cichlidogyrus casuarinus]
DHSTVLLYGTGNAAAGMLPNSGIIRLGLISIGEAVLVVDPVLHSSSLPAFIGMFSYASAAKALVNSVEDDTDPNLLKRKIEIKEDREFTADYEVIEHLGSGKFGEVKRCRELATNQEFACKMVTIHREMDRSDVYNEIKIMQMLRHARLIQLYDVYSLPDCMYLVLELITGGELFERIIDESFDLNESKCGLFMREILQGVEYIHSQKVLHLDLKPENILCLSRTGYKIKIIDFGLAQLYDRHDLRVLFGTPEFVAPEIIAYDPVSPSSDMWSVGVICYVLLSGLSPFMDNTEAETLNNIMRVTYSFNYIEFNSISSDAKDLIKRLLVKDPKLVCFLQHELSYTI